MRSKELFEDTRHFETVARGLLELRELDAVLFGHRRLADPRKLHIAVHAVKRLRASFL
jgi:hypothetical protein